MSLNQWRNYFRNNPNECNRWSRILRDHGYKVPQDIPGLIKRLTDHDGKIKMSAFMMECYGWKNKATVRKNKSKSRKRSKTRSKPKKRGKTRSRPKKRSKTRSKPKKRSKTRSKSKKSKSKKSRSRPKKRSKKTSRKTSKRKSDNRQCEPQTGSKYLNRNSPPYPANKCCGLVRQGNDGYSYISKEDTKGVCRWVKY